MFEALGFVGHPAESRARVACFHQVGCNALRIREPLEQRLQNVPHYAGIVTDSQALRGLPSAEAVQRVLDGALFDFHAKPARLREGDENCVRCCDFMTCHSTQG